MNERIWNDLLQILPKDPLIFRSDEPRAFFFKIFFIFIVLLITIQIKCITVPRLSDIFIMSNWAIWNRGMGVQRSPITYLNSPESPAECQVINCGRNTNSIRSPD